MTKGSLREGAPAKRVGENADIGPSTLFRLRKPTYKPKFEIPFPRTNTNDTGEIYV